MVSPPEDNVIVTFFQLAFKSVAFTILWIPVYSLRWVVIKFIANFKPNYGRILDAYDSCVEEDYTNGPPKNNLNFTLILEGDLSAKDLQQLYTRNVLEATITNTETRRLEVRYPELKQYQVDFAGFQFWKNDSTFSISNHIFEEVYDDRFKSLRKIHEEAINKPFAKYRSPWDIIVVRNYENANKTLLSYRTHHTLGDTKSMLKVIVECLAQKELKLPNVQYMKYSLFDTIKYYVLLPFYFVYCQMVGGQMAARGKETPWYFDGEEEPLLNIGISKKILMKDIKGIAKTNHVSPSSVITSIIAGAIAKSDSRLSRRGIPCQYVLPKPDHPSKLANHSYSATMVLPTNAHTSFELLNKCNNMLMRFKTSQLHKYDKVLTRQLGTWFNPLRTKFMKNTTFPLIITNIASDTEGFKVGSCRVIDFLMTCAPLPGACGVIITPYSYKDTVEISVTAKSSVLDEARTKKLVELMGKEFENLKNLSL